MIRHLQFLLVALTILAFTPRASGTAPSIILEWDPSPSASAIGYFVWYGTNSGNYFDVVDATYSNSAFFPELLPATTYYFMVTAYNEDLMESDPSVELAHAIPSPNAPPTLAPLPDISVAEDSPNVGVTLTGLGSGAGRNADLIITAASSNPGIVPHPTVTGFSPATGMAELRFTPVTNAHGPATITIAVNNQQPLNNFVSRSFAINVIPVNDPPTLGALTNLTFSSTNGPRTVSLQGITAGAPNESQPLTLTATSSNPALVPDPVVSYYSPGTTGTLQLRATTNAFGTATISVTVSDGQTTNATTTRTFLVTVPGPPETLFIEAESGTITSPMIVAASTDASNGRYVYSESADIGSVTFRVTNYSAGDFIIWCRILSPNNSQDSFYISVDGGPETIYRTANNIWSTTWQWTRVNIDSETAELVFPLASGPHTFRFRSREASTLLDSLYITNNRDFVPVKLNVARRTAPQPATELTFQTAAGYRYALETSTNFTTWTTLWNIATNIPTSRTLSYTNTILASAPRRYYRVRVNP